MSWIETPEDRRRQHTQVFASGNIRDIDRIQERERTRKINSIFWFLFIFTTVLGFISFKIRAISLGIYLFGFALLFLVIIIIRYGLHKKINFNYYKNSHKPKNDWEKLKFVPNWVFKKMKRRHSNVVNGKHHVYKKEGNNFYRKLK